MYVIIYYSNNEGGGSDRKDLYHYNILMLQKVDKNGSSNIHVYRFEHEVYP